MGIAVDGRSLRLFGVRSPHVLSVGLCLAVFDVASVYSQAAATAPAPAVTAPAPAESATPPEIDATKLGVSFDRVRTQLSHQAPSRTTGLRIQETVEVVGKAPRPFLWNSETVRLTSRAVPFGAPTQKDIMKLIVPKEFQNYPMDLNALVQWLMEHLNKKAE